MSRLILLALLVAACAPAHACDWVNIGMWSKHFHERGGIRPPERKSYNEVNKAIGCENIGGGKTSATAYENSYRDTVVWVYRKARWGGDVLKYGVDYGAMAGYHNCRLNGEKVCPMVMLAADFTPGGRLGHKLVLFPGGVAYTTKVRF